MCDCPHATYSFLNESQAQIAHHCLEPELPREEGREERTEWAGERKERQRERIKFGTLCGTVNSKLEISLCRNELRFLPGCTLVTKDCFPLDY